MLNLEKTPMVSHSSNRSATLPNRSLSLGLNNNTNKNNSPTSSPLMSNSAQMSPDKQDIALLQEQYRLVYEGRKALQRKCNALEEHLETLKADREQLQRAGLQANAELARLRAASSATVPRADFEALQQQTASLTPQLEELRTRERRLGKELEEYQAVARQLQAEIGELQEENDQLRANRVAMEAKQAAIEATILEMDVQSGEQHKELECLRVSLPSITLQPILLSLTRFPPVPASQMRRGGQRIALHSQPAGRLAARSGTPPPPPPPLQQLHSVAGLERSARKHPLSGQLHQHTDHCCCCCCYCSTTTDPAALQPSQPVGGSHSTSCCSSSESSGVHHHHYYIAA